MKPLLRLVSFMIVLTTTMGCQKDFKTPSDTLVIGIGSSLSSTWDPRLTRLIHNGLFRINERLEVVPDLVESYEITAPETYRFRLRPGVVFHDGRFLTAEDVAWTLQSVKIDKIRSVEVVDPLTLDVKLLEPFAPFLTHLTVGIVPLGSKDGKVGTGPFALESLRTREEIVLKRHDQYFRGAPRVSRVTFRVMTDENLRGLALKNGRIDALQDNIPPHLLRILNVQQDLVTEITEGQSVTYWGMNLRQGPLQKAEVRRALAQAIDIPSMISYRMSGMARQATGLLPPLHWAYEGEVDRPLYDPKTARELLDQAGYEDPDGGGPLPRFRLTYKTLTNKDQIGLARLLAKFLGDIGVEVRIVPREREEFVRDLDQGRFDLYSLTWVGLSDPDVFYHMFHSSAIPPFGRNRGGYVSPIVDQLTSEGRKMTGGEERREVYREVQKILAKDLPVIPLWHEENVAVFSKRIKGLRLRPNASLDWAAEVSKEPQ